jgi:hypothetical protein
MRTERRSPSAALEQKLCLQIFTAFCAHCSQNSTDTHFCDWDWHCFGQIQRLWMHLLHLENPLSQPIHMLCWLEDEWWDWTAYCLSGHHPGRSNSPTGWTDRNCLYKYSRMYPYCYCCQTYNNHSQPRSLEWLHNNSSTLHSQYVNT